MEKKRSTIRMLAVLMSFVFILSSAVQVFAAPSGQGGKDAAGGGNKVNFRPSPGSGTGGSPPPVPGWQFDAAAVKLSLVVTSTDGISRYNPSLNDGADKLKQPLYSKINPVSLSCDTKAFADLEKEENLGCWGIGGVWIYMPENMYLDCGAAGGKADDEGAIKHTSKGFEWTRSNNNLQKYRLTEKILKSAYEVTKKKKDFNGDKLVICKDAGISSIGDLYDGFIYTNHQNRIYDTPWDKFLELGMTSIKTQKQAEDPANRPKIVGNKAVLYTLLTAMKKVHNGEDAKLDKLFDKALEATLTNDSDFRYIILMEIAAPLYGNSNDLLWLSTNSFAAACVCKDSKEFENFPKRHASKEKTSGMGAGSSSGLGGKNKNEKKETKKGGTSRMRGLLDLRQELDDKCNYSLRYGRGIGGAYQCWMGTLSGSSSARMNGQIDKPYTDGQSASEKRKDIVGSRLSYTGPILTNADGDVVRSKGFQTGKWSDEPKDIEKGDYEKYNWGWGVLSSEDAGIGAAPVMQKAVVSSTNISLVSTVTEAGKEKLDVPNFNFSTLVPDGENSNGYKKLKSWATESLKSIKETGEVSKEVEDMLDEAVDWSTVKLPASDNENVESKKFTKKQREEIKKRLSLLVTGLWKNNKTFVTERNAELFMQMLLSLNSDSSKTSSSSGNSVSADPSKGILLMSTTIKRQKQGTNRFIATSYDTEDKKPLDPQTVMSEFNTSNMLTAEKLDINTDKIGEGLVLEGAQVTGNTDDIKNLGNIADETVKDQGGDPNKKYFAQPIVMYGCYLKLDPLVYVHNNQWDKDNNKSLGSIDFTDSKSILKSKVDKTEKSKNDYVSMPKGSIDVATAELQALITDWIADSKEYLNLEYESSGGINAAEAEKRLDRELQIRILMWLDVIRDMRTGVEYRSYTRSDGENSDRVWAPVDTFWSKLQDSTEDKIVDYGKLFNNTGRYSFGVNPESSPFKNDKTESSLGMVFCDFTSVDDSSRKGYIRSHFGTMNERSFYAIMPYYTGTANNKAQSAWICLGDDAENTKFHLVDSFKGLQVGDDFIGEKGIVKNGSDGKKYVNVGALSQYVTKKETGDTERTGSAANNSTTSKEGTHAGSEKGSNKNGTGSSQNKNTGTGKLDEEEEEPEIYDGDAAAEVGGTAAAIDYLTWDTKGNGKGTVIDRMKALGKATGSSDIVSAVIEGFDGGGKIAPAKLDLYHLIDIKENASTKGLSYGGGSGTDKYNISIDSADVGRLIQVALYVSTFCKRETGIPITTESEKAYYWIPGCPYTICKSPWDGGIDSIKGSKNPEGQQADKSVVYRMNGDSEKFADKRISGYSGKNVELHKHTKDIDAITTITLNETFSSMMDIEEKVNKNETWLTDNMKGTYGHSGSILDLAIPVDIVTLFMDKDGNVIENMYEEDGTSGIPGMLGKYDLTNIEKIKSGGREFKVEYQKEQSR